MSETAEQAAVLPPGFDDLEHFVGTWDLPTEWQRYQKRLSTTMPELHLFYDAIQPRMNDVMDYLQTVPDQDITELAPSVRALYHLAQAYFDASNPIELKWRGTDLDDAFPQDRIEYVGPSLVAN